MHQTHRKQFLFQGPASILPMRRLGPEADRAADEKTLENFTATMANENSSAIFMGISCRPPLPPPQRK
jgi:hypothetical protein